MTKPYIFEKCIISENGTIMMSFKTNFVDSSIFLTEKQWEIKMNEAVQAKWTEQIINLKNGYEKYQEFIYSYRMKRMPMCPVQLSRWTIFKMTIRRMF